jgi:hypothetical protein
MSAYDFMVEYKPRASHKVPDELSRMMTLGHSETPTIDVEETFIPCMVIKSDADPLFSTPVFPRPSPLIHVLEPLEAIFREELLAKQAVDPWWETLLPRFTKGSTRQDAPV